MTAFLFARRAIVPQLILTPNQQQHPRIPLPLEGRVAIVTDVGSGMRWTRWHQLTSDAHADGEVVWFWRPDAGAKLVRSKLLLRGDGGKKARFTGKSTK